MSAAVAALALGRGGRVAVVKPAQTGAGPGDPGDLDEVRRLAGAVDAVELARFPDPLSPEAAARAAGVAPLDLADAARQVRELAASHEEVVVEGAGGLLVRYNAAGATIADLAQALAAPALVVTAAGLGTLNHTALTLEALAARRVALAGVVLGAWPDQPGLAERHNVRDLETIIGAALAGAVPAGAGALPAGAFRRRADASLAPGLGGSFDPARFRETNAVRQKELT